MNIEHSTDNHFDDLEDSKTKTVKIWRCLLNAYCVNLPCCCGLTNPPHLQARLPYLGYKLSHQSVVITMSINSTSVAINIAIIGITNPVSASDPSEHRSQLQSIFLSFSSFLLKEKRSCNMTFMLVTILTSRGCIEGGRLHNRRRSQESEPCKHDTPPRP